MANQLQMLICVMLLLMTAVLLVASRTARRHRDRRWKFTLLFLGLMLWQGAELGFFITESLTWLQVLYDFKLAVISFLAVLLFFILLEFYRLDFPPWLPPALCLVPGVTALLGFSTLNHGLLIRSFQVLSTAPATVVNATRGVWFYVHTVYCLALLAAMAVVVAVRCKGLPRAYLEGTGPLAVAFFAMLLGVVAELMRPMKSSMDFILIAATLAGLLFYVSIVRNGRSDYLQIERREIFNYLDPAVFVLSMDGWVLDLNRQARGFLEVIGENADGEHFDTFIDGLYRRGKITARLAEDGEADERYFVTVRHPVIYRMRRQALLDAKGGPAGAVVTLEDVTRNRLFIERLQSMAGIDGLTGLYNRYGYQSLLRQLDKPENLPLCVIMGDVNGLKRVNDTYGHAEGDRFLTAVAHTIRYCLREGSYAARVGGDEFVIVSVGCDEAGGLAIMEAVTLSLSQVEGLPEQPSIALGLAIKTHEEQNINSLVASADTRMYTKKGPSNR